MAQWSRHREASTNGILSTYWRSLATFRVRIALNLKGLKYDAIYVDLDAGQQNTSDYKSVNPQMVIPSLVEDDGNVLFQSIAIMEYLDETHPDPPLLPKIRGAGPACGRCRSSPWPTTHPLIVPRVRNRGRRALQARRGRQDRQGAALVRRRPGRLRGTPVARQGHRPRTVMATP